MGSGWMLGMRMDRRFRVGLVGEVGVLGVMVIVAAMLERCIQNRQSHAVYVEVRLPLL